MTAAHDDEQLTGGGAMRIDTNDMISVTEASAQGLSKLISEASKGRQLVVFKNNKPAAAIVDIKTMERLQYLEELEEDLKLIAVAWARSLTDSGERYSLEDVAAELGVKPRRGRDLNRMAQVVLAAEAREDLRDLDGSARKIMLKAIQKLQVDPDKRDQPSAPERVALSPLPEARCRQSGLPHRARWRGRRDMGNRPARRRRMLSACHRQVAHARRPAAGRSGGEPGGPSLEPPPIAMSTG